MMLEECSCPQCRSQDMQGPTSRYYSTCQRCGDLAGEYAHLIAATGRLICGACWRELAWDKHGHKLDDGRTPETVELERAPKEVG